MVVCGVIHLSFAQTAALERGVQKRGVTAASAYFFPRDFVEAPPEKLPEGRHYREFFHEGAQEFSIDFPPILVTFWSLGVLLAPLGASLGPRPQFLMNDGKRSCAIPFF